MTTPQQLLQRLQNQPDEIKALSLLWDSLLPEEDRPDDTQFSLWLSRHDFSVVVKGIQKTGEKFQQLLSRQRRRMDQDFMLRYASGVMKHTTEETFARPQNRSCLGGGR